MPQTQSPIGRDAREDYEKSREPWGLPGSAEEGELGQGIGRKAVHFLTTTPPRLSISSLPPATTIPEAAHLLHNLPHLKLLQGSAYMKHVPHMGQVNETCPP